ncbi:hypothetical protein KUTeg_015580 [Tegillarca granosa]|uniref:HAT C-terminal dimerisation domain-containing protein n=1 Tax=Tegillarca granosa TaxID=220873 RepID=A0ABQ9EU64_TEGGR|nr:hypothetical protein KUTeg_015580 [Tegillarca granosa]
MENQEYSLPREFDDVAAVGDDFVDDDSDINTGMQKAYFNARFLLQLEAIYILPKVAVGEVIFSVSFRMLQHQNFLRQHLKNALQLHEIDDALVDTVESESMFDMFKTEHLRQKFTLHIVDWLILRQLF